MYHMISFPDCVVPFPFGLGMKLDTVGNETRYSLGMRLDVSMCANCIFSYHLAETGDFKIDTTGTYHGMNLKSVTVRFFCQSYQ